MHIGVGDIDVSEGNMSARATCRGNNSLVDSDLKDIDINYLQDL